MATFTYDTESDVLQVLLVDEEEAGIHRTVELAPTVHVDLDAEGRVVGVEFLHPGTSGVDVDLVRVHYGLDLKIPFSFAA